MSDNVRFHSKHHGKAHHTTPTAGYFDSARDPIAGPWGNAFNGNFNLSGCIVLWDTTTYGLSTQLCRSDFDNVVGIVSTIASNSATWTAGSKWTESGSYTYLTDTDNTVGIGTTSPSFALHVKTTAMGYSSKAQVIQ